MQQVYLPDACAISAMYADWFDIGGGVTNYLAVPDLPMDAKSTQFDLPGGYILDGKCERRSRRSTRMRMRCFRQSVIEDVTHSYYAGKTRLHPWKGETDSRIHGLAR